MVEATSTCDRAPPPPPRAHLQQRVAAVDLALVPLGRDLGVAPQLGRLLRAQHAAPLAVHLGGVEARVLLLARAALEEGRARGVLCCGGVFGGCVCVCV